MGNYFDLKSSYPTKFALPQKIAIVGPESTGKSQLARALAEHFGEPWVPEMARGYLEKIQRPYTKNDVEEIARQQLQEEERLAREAKRFLFCDTTLLVIQIWMEHAYGHCPDWIRKSVEERHYDLYFLCDIDLPWEPDPLREHPMKREYFFEKFLFSLKKMNVRYELVQGYFENRTKLACQFLGHNS